MTSPPRSNHCRRIACLFVAFLFALLCRFAESQEPEAVAFVSGFERFARHGDLDQDQAGALLIGELNCAACHAADDDSLAPKAGPHLLGAGIRLQSDWLKKYLANPAGQNPGTTMPHVLVGLSEAERSDAIDALTAFLGTHGQPFTTLKAGGALPVVHEFWNRGEPTRGRRLFHTVGCVACHQPDPHYETTAVAPSAVDALIEQLEPEEIEELGLAGVARRVHSVPHSNLAEKYSKRSLTMMLIDPAKVRPSARMPSLRLSPAEAADIAAYLLEGKDVPGEIPLATANDSQDLVDAGRTLFVQLRCANCHRAKIDGQPIMSRPMSDLNPEAEVSCMFGAGPAMPRYLLDSTQVTAIRKRLGRDASSNSSTARESVRLEMLRLNCLGCHSRSEFDDTVALGGIGRFRKPYFETVNHVDLGDEGRLPPPLTGIGRKLLPSTLAGVFEARTAPRRPFMTIRMPAYPSEAVKSLVTQLPEADDADVSSEHEVFGVAGELVEAGRELINTGCVDCHPLGGDSLPGVVGVDLNEITKRVHPKWFQQFVFNPADVKKRTRMPTFFPDGRSNQQDLLDGDVEKQIAAIWLYLKDLPNQPLPEKIAKSRSANYELVPKNRPIILRTFMSDVGTHAIAIGFPQGVHFAFDSEAIRPAIAWKGRFLDARGTWFERFTPPAEPLGDQLVRFPLDFPFSRINRERIETAAPQRVRFGGFQIDTAGVPTLLYDFDRWTVEDRFESTEEKRLRRKLTIRAPATEVPDDEPESEIAWLAHAGRTLQRVGPMSFVDAQGLTVTVSSEVGHVGELHKTEQSNQWLIPLGRFQEKTIEAEYQW